ncbi:UNVERIFIED_CONTAM: Magnesium transporter MRS2-I [Sesamum radiatum]|uniref:Magnesium transporter MRS2-I n=1 Tax=Sesamum radiatum TaxID=300843 RepID=A0AAW2W808_SESRA
MAGEDGFMVEAQMSFKKKGAVSRSWMVLDGAGQGVVLDLDKYDIMRRVPINARDLRILDPLLSYPSAILGREKAIVLNLEANLKDSLLCIFLPFLLLCLCVFLQENLIRILYCSISRQ